MHRSVLLAFAVVLASGCSQPPAAKVDDQASRPGVAPKRIDDVVPVEPPVVTPPTEPLTAVSTPQPIAAEPSEPVPAEPGKPIRQKWSDEEIPAPARSKPQPTSVLGNLPDAEAIALVVTKDALELVAVGPTPWRLELATGDIHAASFQPAVGLVVFYRGRSIWAVDLLEPLTDPNQLAPAAVELARMPADAPEFRYTPLVLCVPDEDGRWSRCWPNEPEANDIEPVPAYLSLFWGDEPAATWHAAIDKTDEPGASWDSYDDVNLEVIGGAWLRDRAGRRKHFADIRKSIHGFSADEGPLLFADVVPAELCWRTTEECGLQLPLGDSGWDWVVVGSSRGDLFHVHYAVHDPVRARWANWELLLAGTPKWIPTDELSSATLTELGMEEYPLFDGAGRVFASPSGEQLCWFRYDEQTKHATAVECVASGGRVAGFLSVSTELGMF